MRRMVRVRMVVVMVMLSDGEYSRGDRVITVMIIPSIMTLLVNTDSDYDNNEGDETDQSPRTRTRVKNNNKAKHMGQGPPLA